MSTGKNASYRYRLIDNALRNTGRTWSFNDLLLHLCDKLEEEFDVNLYGNKTKALSERQLAEDIHIMRKDPPQGYAAPIIRKEGLVYYEDPNFSINDNPLNETDIDTLNEVLSLIKPFRTLPYLRKLETIIAKTKGSIIAGHSDEIIQLENNPYAQGLNFIDKSYTIIKDEKVALITYKPFTSELTMEFKIHPYILKEYINRWFLIGWDPLNVRYNILGLDRIIKITALEEPVDKSQLPALLQLQKNIIGVSIFEGPITEIKFWVTTLQVPYIVTKPLHSSQKMIEELTDGCLFTINVIPNFELEQILLSFGERVKIIEPAAIRDKIHSRLSNAIDLY